MSYDAEVHWRRGADERFVDKRYSRAHTWRFDGGVEVQGSASPHAVPLPFSRTDAVDPEEALVAALASCHMLTFLFICANEGYALDAYGDAAHGEVGVDAEGRRAVTRVTLRPHVVFSGAKVPGDAEIEALHHRAHDECIVANSVRTEVLVAGTHSRV